MKRKIFCVVLFLLLFLSGCINFEVVYDENDNINLYGREYTELMASSDGFGKGRTDDIYVALDYFYSNEEIKSIYDEEFELTEQDVICYNSTTHTQFFMNRFKGEALYSFKVGKEHYLIKITKDYNKKWEVVSCELENGE